MLSCALCNKEFNLITNTHLKTHNLTQAEYKEKYGEVASDEYKSVISERSTGNTYNVGRKQRPETIEKRRQKLIGHVVSDETKHKLSDKRKDYVPSNETRQKMSAAAKGRISPMKGRKQTEEAKQLMSLHKKGKPKSEEFKQHLVEYYKEPENKKHKSEEMTEYYKTHEHKGKKVLFEYAELRRQGIAPSGVVGYKHTEEWFEKTLPKILGLAGVRPNKIETKLLNILDNIWPNEWKYVGDGSLVISRKNPDFINVNGIDLIELFGDYWHKGQNSQERINFFEKYGYNCFVIWEHAIKAGLAIEQLKMYFQEA